MRDTFFHKIINNLMRVSKDQYEIFYIAYFVQRLFHAINKKYK